MTTALKRVAKAPAWPFLRYFDRRFQDVHERLDAQVGALDAGVDRGVASTQALQHQVATDLETVSELTLTLERFAERFGDRMGDVLATLQRLLEPTVTPWARPAELVELPFAHAAARRLPPDARVLVLAHPMSTLPLSLASLGFSVTAFDVGPEPGSDPRLRIVTSSIEEWEGPPAPLDAAFLLSEAPCRQETNRGSTATREQRVVELLGKWMHPAANLVLAVPYGPPSVDAAAGVYESGELEALVAEWNILDRQIYASRGSLAWEPLSVEDTLAARETGRRQLELLLLTPRA